MMSKRELWEIHQSLNRVEAELSSLKIILNKYFIREEQDLLQYEASIGSTDTDDAQNPLENVNLPEEKNALDQEKMSRKVLERKL